MPWLVLLESSESGPRLRVVPGPAGEAPSIATSEHCTVALAGDLDRDTMPDGDTGAAAAELVRDTYLRHGVEFFPRLRGSFVLVVWDARDERLLAVRDPMGTHPLFYATLGSSLAVSPSADALAATPFKLNAVAAAAYILGASLPADQTLHADVKRLPQGHLLELRSGEEQVRRYWHPQSPPPEARPAADDHSLGRFEEVLRQAVERCLGFGTAGVYLSGGLDSASIATVATDACSRRGIPNPLALLALFRGTETDEETVQRTVAEALGLQQLARTPKELLGERGMLRAALELARTASAGPPQLVEPLYDELARLAREEGCRTILSGIGGDDWLLPPPVYAAERLRMLDIPALVPLARAWLGYWPEFGHTAVVTDLLWPFGLRPLVRVPATRAARRIAPGYVARARSQRLTDTLPNWIAPGPSLRHELVAALLERPSPARSRDLVAQSRRTLLDHVTPSLMLENAFAVRDRTGVRILAPLLDPDVVSFLYSAPPGRLVADGRAKALAAELAGPRVPAFARAWPRTVYGDSLWRGSLASEGAAAWSEIGGTELLAELGVVDSRLLWERLAQPSHAWSGREPGRVIRALSLEMWLRSRIVGSREE